MPVLAPDHLFEQAERLVVAPLHGPPRQIDIRRAISSSYYGVFHFTPTAVADAHIGSAHRATMRSAGVYRKIRHEAFRKVCEEARKTAPSPSFKPSVPKGGFGPDIMKFATAAIDLQSKRHDADYNPQPRFKTSDAKSAINAAPNAVDSFRRAADEKRIAFLTLLLVQS